jgi:amino acid transporter
MAALKQRGISRDDLPYKAKFMPWLAYYAAFFFSVIILVQGFDCFVGEFSTTDFFVAYISVILFVILWIGFQLVFRTRLFWRPHEIDIDTDRREIDSIVWEEDPPSNIWEKFWHIVA